jgi:tRNA (guanine10-N2)-dimethyltransferase
VTRLFFLVSGEHNTLPFAEVRAILEAEGFKYKILGKLSQIFRMKTSTESMKSIVRRASLTRVCSIELAYCDAVDKEIHESVSSSPVEKFLRKNETFVVRIRRIGESSPELAGNILERQLGAELSYKADGAKVNLTTPDKTFFGVLTDNKFIFGVKQVEIIPKPFVERRPRKRPFFHPSSMPAKLARCMVNLAQPKAGDLVLDPFCGTGSMLIEAGLIGCRVVGFDVQKRMVRGSLKNIINYGIKPEGMGVADARQLPVTQVDCIVTDPPYGRSATTMGQKTKKIVMDFLSKIGDNLKKSGRVCIASPRSVRIGKIGEQLGFKRLESHFVYVHRSLTREITVLERVK